MKLLAQFNQFLNDVVNLNQTRITLLEESTDAIERVVRGLDWEPRIRDFAAQGSWAHQTIIRPQSGKPFDADLLVYVDPVEGWTAADYLRTLYDDLHDLDTYKDKLRRFSHCVTIEYAGVRKIDITPCVRGRVNENVWEVCNRNTDEFERSNPLDYTSWVKEQNGVIGGNDLKKATRLLKYLRDIKETFTCPSFLLTTLLGMQVRASDVGSAAFADLPTTLKTLVGRLDSWLQARPIRPTIRNPVLYEEVQSSVWDDAKYANFREKIQRYREWIDDAFDEADRDESIAKWQRVFGSDFAKTEARERAANVSEAAADTLHAIVVGGAGRDLVTRVVQRGVDALPAGFSRLPHMERPKWRRGRAQYQVGVTAELFESRAGYEVGPLASLAPVDPHMAIRFVAANPFGIPFPPQFKVMWRVTNTDRAAEAAGALRGDFYRSDDGMARWETTRYRGVHMVEAFLIEKRTDTLHGQSAPFFVVIS